MSTHPLATRTARAVWFNSILEALTLSEDHLDYVQQLILTGVSDSSPFLTPVQQSNDITAQYTSPIPEMLVSIAKGDYIKVFLHEKMFGVLTLLQSKLQNLIKMVKHDPSLPLQLNLINIFADTLKEWLDYGGDNINLGYTTSNPANTEPITTTEHNQFLLIILAIASINIFTQVNYSGLPIVVPYTLQQYRENSSKVVPYPTSDSLDDIDDIDEDNSVRNESLQTRVNLFFTLFSSKLVKDTREILELADKNNKSAHKGKKWIQVEKAMLCNSALKLNGEDAYHCAHFPLFLIIARAIFGCEDLLKGTIFTTVPSVNKFQPTLTSVFAMELNNHIEYLSLVRGVHSNSDGGNGDDNDDANDEQTEPFVAESENFLMKMAQFYPHGRCQNISLFGCPSLLTWTLRAVKIHSEILLAPTATIRTEFYTLSLLYQLQYGILSSGTDFVPRPSTHCPHHSQTTPHDTICSEFKCIPFKAFHLAYQQTPSLLSSPSTQTLSFTTLFNTLSYLMTALPQIEFVDSLTGADLKSTMQSGQLTPSLSSQSGQIVVSAGHADYDAVLLLTYNHFANTSDHSPPSALAHHTTTSMDASVDDIHAVGISPLTHTHTHAAYKPLILFPTYITSSSPTPTTSIPLTLSTSIFTTITIELASIALKLYLYKRSFLLLSLSKIFSGLSIFVSGVLGRKTRYQSRSFAQLHGISFLHKDVIRAIEYDSRNTHLTTPTSTLTFVQISTNPLAKTITSPESTNNTNNNDDGDEPPALETTLTDPITTTIFHRVPNDYIISLDLTDSMISPYIIKTDDAEALIPQVVEETNTKFLAEKEKYKGVINERNPTIPRIAKLSHTVSTTHNTTSPSIADRQTFALCVTRGGHIDDVPIDSIDDVYLTYMLPDDDNYNVDAATSTNLKNGTEILNFDVMDSITEAGNNTGSDTQAAVKAGSSLEGVVHLLATSNGGLVFEANTTDLDSDYTQQNQLKHTEPPLDQFEPYMQTAMGSVLTLAVGQYLYQTCPQTEITQQEQDCYLQTIFSHRFSQGNHYFDAQKNKYGQHYQEYSSLFDCQAYSTPYQTIVSSLMMRSILEYTNSRLQVRAISQIELLTNLFITQDEQLSSIQFSPNYLTDLVDMYHNIAIDSTTYDLSLRQVIKSKSPLMYLYSSISTPHHQFQREQPEVYNSLIQKTIRNLTRFRQNKVFTSSSCPWWETLRTCADICHKTGFITSSLRCYVNVQLWSMVIDTLIKIGRRGDATKLLKHVLKIPQKFNSDEFYQQFKENQQLELEYKEKQAQKRHDAEAARALIDTKLKAQCESTISDDFAVVAGFDTLSATGSQDDRKSNCSSPSSRSSGVMVPILSPMTPITFQKSEFELELDQKSRIKKHDNDSTNQDHNGDDGDDADHETNTDADYREGSLLDFVAKAMESTMYTTTTSSGLQTFSASSYRLYHLLGESCQDENFWRISWDLSTHTYAPPQRSLAKWLAVRKRNNEAYIAYQNALGLNGSDHQTWYECGVVATRLEQYEKAIPCFSNALRLKPDISEGWNNLAACHLYLENIGSAYHALSQCLRTHSSSWKIWENFLQCSLQLNLYHDVLRALTNISQLKGKIDPMTLLPIQYTTSQSKFHVFALYMTWFEHLETQIKTQIETYLEHHVPDKDGELSSTLTSCDPSKLDTECSHTNHNGTNRNDGQQCSLCIEVPLDQELAKFISQQPQQSTSTQTWSYFPTVKNFVNTIHSVMTNISHNESREAQMGGMIRGGGDDAGAGNSISAQMDFNRANSVTSTAPTSQGADDNADDIGQDNHSIDIDDDEDELMRRGKFLQVLSKSAKGQKAILHYLLGLSHKKVAIQSDFELLKQSSTNFESTIDIIIKILIENSYSPLFMPHLDFLLTNLKLIVQNATMMDDHVLRHHRDYVTEPLRSDDRHGANNKELLKLLCDRLTDGLRRDYDNNRLNLAHLIPYIGQFEQLTREVKSLCDEDEILYKTYGPKGSGEVAQAAEDIYEYDPYGSFY